MRSKEEADHNLPYIIAAALLDNQVMPTQYLPERIRRRDIQALLRKITVRPLDEFSQRFPALMPCRITVRFNNGLVLTKEKSDYEGFQTRPMEWDTVVKKFEQLSQAHLAVTLRVEIEDAVRHLENLPVRDLTALLEKVK